MTTRLAFVPDPQYPEGKVGWLCVRHADCYGDTPEQSVNYWPIEHGRRRDYAEAFPELDTDAPLYEHGTGAYSLYRGMGSYSPVLRLTDGGSTKPVKFERLPIPCPKVRAGIETRFYRGQWQKYLKSTGWTAA